MAGRRAYRITVVIEPVSFLRCAECDRWVVVVDQRRSRFCSKRCRNRYNVRAFRARAEVA